MYTKTCDIIQPTNEEEALALKLALVNLCNNVPISQIYVTSTNEDKVCKIIGEVKSAIRSIDESGNPFYRVEVDIKQKYGNERDVKSLHYSGKIKLRAKFVPAGHIRLISLVIDAV